MSEPMPEPMAVAAPKEMNIEASGVPVGTLRENVEFDYTLQFHQNIELQSTITALKQYFRRAKNQRLLTVYLETRENQNVVNSLRIYTERITD